VPATHRFCNSPLINSLKLKGLAYWLLTPPKHPFCAVDVNVEGETTSRPTGPGDEIPALQYLHDPPGRPRSPHHGRNSAPRLGVRSGGEGATTPALAVVINAIVDALAELGVSHIEMPATPERVWRATQATRERSGTVQQTTPSS
jgi:hypothetical protein